MAFHHRLWATHTVERHRAWHAIIDYGLADKVRRCRSWHAIIALGWQTWSNYLGHGMPSSPLGSTDGRMTSSVACHQHLWPANTVERRRAWHAIIAFGQHTRSNNVECGMPSSPLGSTHYRTTSGVACHHSPWTTNNVDGVRRCMPSLTLGITNGLTMSGVACHHSP